MNPPEGGWDGIADIKIFEDGARWVVCPYCFKKNIKVLSDTKIKHMPWKCKGSNCRKDFIVNV